MASATVPRPLSRQESAVPAAPLREAARHADLELVGLLAGIAGIVLAAVVVFGATAPVG